MIYGLLCFEIIIIYMRISIGNDNKCIKGCLMPSWTSSDTFLFFPLIIERKKCWETSIVTSRPNICYFSPHRLSGEVRCKRPLCERITQTWNGIKIRFWQFFKLTERAFKYDILFWFVLFALKVMKLKSKIVTSRPGLPYPLMLSLHAGCGLLLYDFLISSFASARKSILWIFVPHFNKCSI